MEKEIVPGIGRKPKERLVEIVRSFSYKLNVGNYESRDFFCSQKIECPESEAEEASKRLYEFCRKEVMLSVSQFKIGMSAKERSEKAGFEARDEVD